MNARKWNRLRKKLPHLLKWWPNWERLSAGNINRIRRMSRKQVEAVALGHLLRGDCEGCREFSVDPYENVKYERKYGKWSFVNQPTAETLGSEQPVKKV